MGWMDTQIGNLLTIENSLTLHLCSNASQMYKTGQSPRRHQIHLRTSFHNQQCILLATLEPGATRPCPNSAATRRAIHDPPRKPALGLTCGVPRAGEPGGLPQKITERSKAAEKRVDLQVPFSVVDTRAPKRLHVQISHGHQIRESGHLQIRRCISLSYDCPGSPRIVSLSKSQATRHVWHLTHRPTLVRPWKLAAQNSHAATIE